jgi:hypothetical protein
MKSTLPRAAFIGLSILSLLHAVSATSRAGFLVDYSGGPTEQVASAEFSFRSCHTLEIVLRELTPPPVLGPVLSGPTLLAAGSPVLTRIGFNLPSGHVTGGSAVIGPGGASVGFENVSSQLGAGDDVSAHWGYSAGTLPEALKLLSEALTQESNARLQEAEALDLEEALAVFQALSLREAAATILSSNPDPQMKKDAEEMLQKAERLEAEAALLGTAQAEAALLGTAQAEARAEAQERMAQANEALIRSTIAPVLHFVGVLQPGQTPFLPIPPGSNLIGPGAFDGIQGGLLGDLVARNGQGVIGNSVVITLTLSDPYDLALQAAFFEDLRRNSLIEYGNQMDFISPTTSAVPEPSTVTLLLALGTTLVGVTAVRRLWGAVPFQKRISDHR